MNSKCLFVFLLLLFSCNRISEKSAEHLDTAKKEINAQKKKLLKKGFNVVFGEASSKKTTFDEQFSDHKGLAVEHIDGVWIDLPAGYYYCFLKYKADQEKLFRFIENLPTKYENISDKKFRETTSERLQSNLNLLQEDYPDEYAQLSFFSGLPERSDILYYQCNRYPKIHIIAIDEKNGIIYHHFERYSD